MLALALLQMAAALAVNSFQIDGVDFSMDLPGQWRAEENFMGAPLMVLGPFADGKRPIVIVVPTTIPAKTLTAEVFQQGQATISETRMAWLSKRRGLSLGEFPGETLTPTSGTLFHTTGHRYVVGTETGMNETFEQRTYHAVCGGKYFYISTLVHEKQFGTYIEPVKQIAESLRCTGG